MMNVQRFLSAVCAFLTLVGFVNECIASESTKNNRMIKWQKMIVKKDEQNNEEIVAKQPIRPIALTRANQPQFPKAKALFERAFDYQTKADYDRAIEVYISVTVVCPDLYEAYYNMALCYEELHNKNDAIKCFEEAASLNRFYKPIFFNLGKLYSDQGNEPKAATNWAIYNQM